MSAPKWIIIGSLTLFSVIGISAFIKKSGKKSALLDHPIPVTVQNSAPAVETEILSVPTVKSPPSANENEYFAKDDFPIIDRIYQLFSVSSSKLPIVETITYASSVPWLKGRPAWIADYAVHFGTSRHFIARSLNSKPDYFSQKVREGSVFNVFRKDKQIQFYLLADVSRCKMGFYYVDLDTNERVLLKTYRIGVGRKDANRPSGTLTPLGRYSLGDRVAIFKPGVQGDHKQIQAFGTRWIPFGEEIERTSAPAKGYGLQGAPWVESQGELVEQRDVINAYDSEGGILLASEDIEELYAIIITKPTFIEIVKDFHEAKLPGVEVAAPSR